MSVFYPPTSERVRIQWLLEQAEFWAAENQHPRARQLFLDAMALDRSPKSRWEYAGFLSQIGENAAAIEQLHIIWNDAKRHNQNQWAAAACEFLSIIFQKQGQWAAAGSYQQQAIAARVRSQNPMDEDDPPMSEFLATANHAIVQRDWHYAEELVNCALASANERNCLEAAADAWGTRGAIDFLNRRYDPAWQCFLNAYFLHCRVKDQEGRVVDLLNLAAVSREEGRWELARRLLRKASAEARRLNHPQLSQTVDSRLVEAQRVLEVLSRVPEWN